MKAHCEYLVVEFGTAWEGRAFHLAKTEAGTDKESESYSVFCGIRNPQECHCDCKGFTYGNGNRLCKHILAIQALLENGWLNSASDVQADEKAFQADMSAKPVDLPTEAEINDMAAKLGITDPFSDTPKVEKPITEVEVQKMARELGWVYDEPKGEAPKTPTVWNPNYWADQI